MYYPTVNFDTSNLILNRKEGAVSQPPVEDTTVQAEQPLNLSESDMTTHEPQQQAPEEQHRTEYVLLYTSRAGELEAASADGTKYCSC